mgnify:CR=1 FL=1
MAVQFGYSINKSNTIDMDTAPRAMESYLLLHEPSFARCIGCGCCTATCSSGVFTQLNLRQIQLRIRRGETQGLLPEIQKCMLCGKCQMVCPRGVSTRNVVLSIQRALQLLS